MSDCTGSKQNLSKSRCSKLPALPLYMITTPDDFVLTTANLASASALRTALQNALKAAVDVRVYLWPKFSNAEDASEETVYSESPFGSRKIRDGNYRFKFMISKSLCLHKAMFSHSGTGGRVIIVDSERQILLTEDSNGDYRGLSIDLLNVEKIKINMGDVLTESPVYVSLADNKEIDESGFLFDCSVINELEPLTDVELAVSAVSAANFTVTVTQKCDGTPVSGLVKADFAVTNSAGAAQVVNTVVEGADGVYLIDADTTFVDGFVDLVEPDALTLDAYESTGPQAVNVP
jgi:hypothetical protein